MEVIAGKFGEGKSDFERSTKKNFQFSKFWGIDCRVFWFENWNFKFSL